MKLSTANKLIADELDRALKAHKAMNSPHEGFAVLQEEVDELWQEVKGGNGTTHRGVSEAVQIAAMALRYLVDLCPESSSAQHEMKVRQHHSIGSFVGGYSG